MCNKDLQRNKSNIVNLSGITSFYFIHSKHLYGTSTIVRHSSTVSSFVFLITYVRTYGNVQKYQ